MLLKRCLKPVAMSFSAIADAANASERLYDAFVAELLDDHQSTNTELDVAVRVKAASFTWDAPPPDAEDPKKKKKGKKSKEYKVDNEQQLFNHNKCKQLGGFILEFMLDKGLVKLVIVPKVNNLLWRRILYKKESICKVPI